MIAQCLLSNGPEPPLPSNDILHVKSFPNPFTQQVSISAISPYSRLSELQIYDLEGKLINVLHAARRPPQGEYLFEWNGTDTNGHQACPGVYLARLTANGESITLRMTLIR
jgi:flagellar hook assembly protein FlgD